MARISTYSVDSLPTLDDKVIGTDSDDSSITKNYKIGDIIGLVNQSTSLQDVLNVDNSATEDINLNGKIATENLQVNDSTSLSGGTVINDVLEVWADSTFEGSVNLQSFVLDSQSQVGTLGQVLRTTGNGVEWSDEAAQVQQTLQSVLDNGNTAVQSIGLTGSIQVVGDIRTDGLRVDEELKDSLGLNGTSGQLLSSTGTATKWIDAPSGGITNFTYILTVKEIEPQVPTGVNTPLRVTFGNGQSTTDVLVDANGNITFNTAGGYFFSGIGNFRKIDGSSQASILFYRVTLNGVQIGETKIVELDKIDYGIPMTMSYALTVNAGDVLNFEVMRDASSDVSGGLYPFEVTGGTWTNVPSTELTIWKLTN